MNDLSSASDTGRFRVADPASMHRRRPSVVPLVRDTYAAVLAGGKGSRLHQLTAWRAKPAVPFGGKHRIIDFALSNCINSGIRRIGVATQYKAHSLIQHLQRGWSFLDNHLHEFLDVLPAQQRVSEGWYDGTADALYQNLDILRIEAPRFVLVLAGDHVYKMDYGVLLAEHADSGADVTIACTKVPLATASAFGVIDVRADGTVSDIIEKPHDPAAAPGDPSRALVSMGIYVFNAPVLYEALLADTRRRDTAHDFARDVVPELLRQGRVVRAHSYSDSCVNVVDGRPYWRDVGTVDAYWEANLDLARIEPELDMYDPAWPIRTLEESLPPARFIYESPDPRGQALNSLVSSGCVVRGAAVIRSLLFTSVTVERDSVIEDSVVLPAVRIGRGVRLACVVVDKFCDLPDGFEAGVDRVADEARFHVTAQGVVLITPEMLGQRVHEFG